MWNVVLHPLAVFVALVVIVLTYFFLFSKRSTKEKKVLSQYVGEAEEENSDRPRRNIHFLEKLTETPDPSVNTLHELFEFAARKFGKKRCYGWRELVKVHQEVKHGKTWSLPEMKSFQWISFEEAFERAKMIGFALKQLGLKKGDNLGIYEHTRLEWSLVAHGCMSQNITLLTAYDTLDPEGLMHCLKLGDVSHLVTNAQLLAEILKIRDNLPLLKCIIYSDEADQSLLKECEQKEIRLITFQELEEMGRNNPSTTTPAQPDDTALIMFTSGSTGTPKGVLLTHRNILATIGGVIPDIKHLFDPKEDIYANYLPLAHILAFAFQFGTVFLGIPCGFGSPRTLFDDSVKNCQGDLVELKPTCFVGVPKILERMRKRVLDNVNSSGFIRRHMFDILYKYKLWRTHHGFTTPWLDKLVFRKFSDLFGGRIRVMLAGGAPLSPSIQEFIEICFGVSVIQGYGLTETSGPCTMASIKQINKLTVGPPIGACEIKLVDVEEMGYSHTDQPLPRGEIYVRGPCVAAGYYKQEDLTRESWTESGWMITGDIGTWHSDGTLQVIDRKKNFVKGRHGEFVPLEKLETTYRKNKYVEELVVTLSSEHDWCVAILQPKKKLILECANELNQSDSYEDLCKTKEIRKRVLHSLQETGKENKLQRNEIVQNVYLDPVKWNEKNGFIGATMKAQRHKILHEREEQIKQMYEELED